MLKKASEYSASYINNNLELKNKIQYGIDNNLVFKFGDEENGYRQLAGYWISKYEVSE